MNPKANLNILDLVNAELEYEGSLFEGEYLADPIIGEGYDAGVTTFNGEKTGSDIEYAIYQKYRSDNVTNPLYYDADRQEGSGEVIVYRNGIVANDADLEITEVSETSQIIKDDAVVGETVFKGFKSEELITGGEKLITERETSYTIDTDESTPLVFSSSNRSVESLIFNGIQVSSGQSYTKENLVYQSNIPFSHGENIEVISIDSFSDTVIADRF
ncbi:MAG: hypothetical protein AAGF07_01095 [Patescibacteria group bacterium]